jgi:hypothetical protein
MADPDVLWPVGTTDRDPDLDDHARHLVRKSPSRRVAAAVTDDDEADRATRSLSDCRTPHFRHHRRQRRRDVVPPRPTSPTTPVDDERRRS